MFAILLGYLLSVSHVFCFTNPAGGTCMCLEGKIICKRIVIVINDSSHELGADPVPEAPTRVGSGERNNRSKVLHLQKFCRETASNPGPGDSAS
jgi:hypothetical protein